MFDQTVQKDFIFWAYEKGWQDARNLVKAFSTRAVSSFGRASALQAEGGRFDSYTAHQHSLQTRSSS